MTRQRGKRAVWLPNELLKQIDPDCGSKSHQLPVMHFSSVYNWSVARAGAGTLISAYPLAAEDENRPLNVSVFSSLFPLPPFTCLSPSSLARGQRKEEKVTWEDILAGPFPMGGQRARSQGLLGTAGAYWALGKSDESLEQENNQDSQRLSSRMEWCRGRWWSMRESAHLEGRNH